MENMRSYLLKKNEEEFNTNVVKCSSLKKIGIYEIWKIINDFYNVGKKRGWIKQKRSDQLIKWMWEDLQKNVLDNLKKNQKLLKQFSYLEKQVLKTKILPTEASKKILHGFVKNNKKIY